MIPSHWTEHDLTVNGVSLHYLRTGHGNKPPLVLVHGFSDNGACWRQNALDLEAEYDIVMPDARGHGGSARVEPGQAVDFAADLAGLIAALGLHKPIVGGHSMGAMIAFELGARYPDVPRALLLEDPPWFNPDQQRPQPQSGQHPRAAWVQSLGTTSLETLKAQAREEHPAWPDWVIDTWCAAKKQLDPNILSVLNIGGTDWPDKVPQLACPTLIVTADPDRGGLVTPAIAARVQELNANCRVVHIPDTGHHVRFEDYETYMQQVRAFLQSF